MALTTTQASALVELKTRGTLTPASHAFSKYDGRRTFARRTLQALVDNGFADWAPAVRGTRNGPRIFAGFIVEAGFSPMHLTGNEY